MSPDKLDAVFSEGIAAERLPIGRGKVVRIAGKEVALFNVDGTIYALDDACAHAGASLGSGKLRGGFVTCPGHGFQYDVRSGFCASISGLRVASYPVKVVDGKIMVAVGA